MGYLMQQQMDQGNINNIMCELLHATNVVQYFYNYPRLFTLLKDFDEETFCFALNSITIDSVMASNYVIIDLFINKIVLPKILQADIIKNQQYTSQTDMEIVKNQVYKFGEYKELILSAIRNIASEQDTVKYSIDVFIPYIFQTYQIIVMLEPLQDKDNKIYAKLQQTISIITRQLAINNQLEKIEKLLDTFCLLKLYPSYALYYYLQYQFSQKYFETLIQSQLSLQITSRIHSKLMNKILSTDYEYIIILCKYVAQSSDYQQIFLTKILEFCLDHLLMDSDSVINKLLEFGIDEIEIGKQSLQNILINYNGYVKDQVLYEIQQTLYEHGAAKIFKVMHYETTALFQCLILLCWNNGGISGSMDDYEDLW
ncbi:Hypothetical_protein [Hexamita inflata]|uniref:Hypothetical_protein n=1 Tax=Hexamita inflata TaxID=28002 RepID=A0AA86Q502_9EUKA|nr:Hypothetical protein HINF_LOCUS38291 [Hexamita inflata]